MLLRRLPPLGLALLWFSSLLPSALCACYEPDGQLHTDDAMQPCPNANLETICCALNRTNYPGGDVANGATRDECMPSGLCASRITEAGEEKVSYWRDFCTERDWTSGKCLNVCTDGDFVAQYGNTQVTPCDGTNTSAKWCCGDTKDCCTLPDNNPNVIRIAQTFGASTATSSASPTASTGSITDPTGSTSPASSTSAAPNNGDSGGLSTGAKAGIGIGAAIGGLLLLGLGFFIAKSLQWKKKAEGTGTTGSKEAMAPGYPNSPPPSFGNSVSAYRAPEPIIRHELPAGKDTQEMA